MFAACHCVSDYLRQNQDYLANLAGRTNTRDVDGVQATADGAADPRGGEEGGHHPPG